MKRLFPPRKSPRAIARTDRAPSASGSGKLPYDSIALAVAIWLAILVAGQLLARLPDLPRPEARDQMVQVAYPAY